MAGYRVLDIETVTDMSVWTPPTPRWVLQPFGDLTPVADSTSRLMAPAGVVMDEPFAPPQAQRVVAMSWVDLSSEDNQWYCFQGLTAIAEWKVAAPDLAERQMLMRFSAAEDADEATIVTWNGRGFDMPVINFRSIKHKIPLAWYYRVDGMRYRYNDAGHCDLMDWLGDYGAARFMKLGDAARLIGLPGKSGEEFTGGGVADVVKRGDLLENMAKVRRYCARDSLQTALLFVRSRFHRGMIEPADHDRAIDSFAASDEVREILPEVDWRLMKVAA